VELSQADSAILFVMNANQLQRSGSVSLPSHPMADFSLDTKPNVLFLSALLELCSIIIDKYRKNFKENHHDKS
jgi:hypothetical protein